MTEKKPILRLDNISKGFQGQLGYSLDVLDKISFEISQGEFKSVLSPKGSGKSTLLKIASGIYKADSGNVENISDGAKEANNFVSYIPSLPSSYPWLNVRQNIEFYQKHSSSGIQPENPEQIKSIIDMVGLSGYENHFPDNRSLGFRFRISLARSLVSNSRLILLDEPFIDMEEKTKQDIYNLVRTVWEKTGKAILIATSNVQEAFFLSDSIILLSKRPSKVLGQIRLNLPVKRGIEITNTSYFTEIKEQIEKIYKENELSIKTVLTV